MTVAYINKKKSQVSVHKNTTIGNEISQIEANKRNATIPMVVTTVVEKKSACPNVQFGSLVAFRNADIPFALAFSTSSMKSSNSSSANDSEKTNKTDFT